ncbi:DNA/RNA non-specific endonuclease [Rhodococcoides fascians]|uniref:DNA/RNA non-specific endonuclease n=1 Tax=Rhodococcoides fascians TaxID=1828 RepID=UPI002788F230|nr:DNA/RNA non-specific endonuclease [Rhodococcus fascians]MDQ0282032.1 endonuclease G [Rhodococcus fascians]
MTTPLGFDPTFLADIDVPLPGRAGLAVLPYTHFSVSMDPARRLAAVTGVNIDGSSLKDLERGDDWRLDERLPAAQQAGNELYSNNDLDRGHLVRRRDPVWGELSVATRANADTFHYTVCAPQTATLNQSKTLWLGLEDYVLGHAEQYGQRLSVFSGCIFADDDPIYRGIAIPRRFFKIAAWSQDSAPACTGYVLDQSPSLDPILDKPLRVETDPPPLGPYRTYQVPVADIASATGLELGSLTEADRYAPVAAARAEASKWTELTQLSDIHL